MKSSENNKKENIYPPLSFKKIIKNENKEKKIFDKLTDVLISYNLFPFFKFKEVRDFGKINIKFYNAFIRYYERACDALIIKYNIKIENNYNPKEIYEQKDDIGHFIKLNFLNLEHYLLFSYHKWAWKNTYKYWEKITPKNSILNKDIYHLKSATYIDIKGKMSHIFNGEYKLYLNHCVCNLDINTIKMVILLDGELLQEFIYPSKDQINKCRAIHSDKEEYIIKGTSKETKDENEMKKVGLKRNSLFKFSLIGKNIEKKDYNKKYKLNREYIMDINILYDEKIDKSSGHELTVKFSNLNGAYKEGWLIDAIILKKNY